MSIHVTDFKWEKGKNDLKYIELLEKTLRNEQALSAKAVAKIRKLAEELKAYHEIGTAEECKDAVENIERFYQHGYNKAIDDFANDMEDYLTEEGYHKKIEINGAKLKAIMEKQIPKKPLEGGMFHCLICMFPLKKTMNYCPGCGQKIDWSEEDV